MPAGRLRRSRRASRHLGAAIAIATTLVVKSGRAVDRFEIEVYDGSANAPGDVSLENHVNFVDRGRSVAVGALAPTEHQAHWTFEGALGATPIWEPGIYLQTALVPDRGFAFAGVKLRSKFVTPRTFSKTVTLGANFELSDVPAEFEDSRFSIEMRPIFALDLPVVLFAINPILSVPLSRNASSGPELEPAISLKGRLSARADLGIEYYAGLGPLGNPLPASQEDQYVYFAGDWVLGGGFDLNLGVGAGLDCGSDPLSLKAILAYDFGRIW